MIRIGGGEQDVVSPNAKAADACADDLSDIDDLKGGAAG